MKKKATCPYCGMVGEMNIKDQRCHSTGKPELMRKFACSRCGKSFWQKEGATG